MGGRLDHCLSALSTLHKWRHLNLVLWGEGNMAQLLPPGKHTIRPAKGFEGPCCGLVPLNGPATLTSTGLRWNLGTASTLLPICLLHLCVFCLLMQDVMVKVGFSSECMIHNIGSCRVQGYLVSLKR